MQVTNWLYFAAVWMFVAGQNGDDNINPETQNYQYRYYVHDESTGDIKSQEETKQGDVVNGHYSVGEPTGDLRVVTYTADEGGFRANVKYEEGGSPTSEDKARQTSAKSGVEFQWLPANPEDIQEGKSSSVEGDSSGDSDQHNGNASATGSVETTTEYKAESTTEASNESSTSESSEIENENNTIEKLPKEVNPSSEVSSSENSSETPSPSTISEASSESTSTAVSTESSEENSFETSTSASVEGKDTLSTDAENSPTESEDSAEAAESAPLSEEVLPPLEPPSQMYLPVINYQNLPFLNLPMLENIQDPRESENRPTIIYASQNFYNPWQWFGSNRRVARDLEFKREYVQKYLDHLAITRGNN